MTALMQTLYDYTYRFPLTGLLTGDEYQGEQVLLEQRERTVRQALPEGAQKQFEAYLDSRSICADIESEALFLATLALAREIF